MWWVSTTTTGDPLLDFLINNASVVGILAFVLIALIRGWLVTGRELKSKEAECERLAVERDRAIDVIYKQAEGMSRALEVAEKVTK
jgi:hypothetical protein